MVTLAGHATRSFRDGLASYDLVTAEAFPAELSPGNTEAAGLAVCNAIGVADGANIGECDPGQDTLDAVVREAAFISPGGFDGDWSTCASWAWKGYGCVNNFGFTDVGCDESI